MTKRAVVVGWPISHSRSPLIHGHWIVKHGLDASYAKLALDPNDADVWFQDFAEHGLAGANVTIPHKETAAKACQNLSPSAKILGAANTLWIEDGVLCGDSTDGDGFVASLTKAAPHWKHHAQSAQALIIGAGGAARAVGDALLRQGVERVWLLNRTIERADAVAEMLISTHGIGRAKGAPLADFGLYALDAGLVVNTTSLGMEGQPSLDVDLNGLASGAAVADIVYAPLETDLLKKAAARSHPTVDGLGMLMHQAVPGFERWFGVRPEVTDELRALLVADLMGQSD